MTSFLTIQKLLIAASVLLIIFACIPFFFIGYTALEISKSSISGLISYYKTPFLTTLFLSTVTGVFVLILSLLTQYMLLPLSARYRKYLTFVLAFPIIFPPYVAAISYISIFKSPWGIAMFGRSPVVEFWQAAFVLSLFLYPYSFLLIKNRFEMIDPSHKKIASLYKWNLFDKLRLLYFPHLKGALLSGFLIPFLYVAADFGAISILRMDTITIELYQSMVRRFSYEEGAFLSLVLLAVSSCALFAGKQLVSSPVASLRRNDQISDASNQSFINRVLSVIWVFSMICFSVFIPLGTIGWWFGQFLQEESMLKNIWFDKAAFSDVIVTTVVIALGVVAVSQLIAFAVQVLALLSGTKYITKLMYYVTTLLHALPAIVIVFSILIFKYATPFALSHALFFLFFAYVLRYIGVAFLTISPAVETIPQAYLRIGSTFIPRLTEQVRLIILPYLRKYLFQSGSYIYFLSLRELTIPLILLPLGMNVLSVRIWQTASEGLYVYASPAILVLLLLSLPSLVWYIKSQT